MKKNMIIIMVAVMILFAGCDNKSVGIDKKNGKGKTIESIESAEGKGKDEKIKLSILLGNKLLYKCTKSIDGGIHNVDYIFEDRNNEVFIKHYYDISYIPDLFIYDEFNNQKLSNNYIGKIESNKVGIINGSRGVNQLSYYKNITKYGKYDNSYFWNNIDNYKVVLLNVKNAIIERDPKNRNYYEKNFNYALKDLQPYEKFFKEKSKLVDDYTFIVQGNSLDYIMAYSGLETLSISDEYDKVINKDKKDQDKIDFKKIIDLKCKNKNKIVFIYYDDNFFKANEKVISEYNIKCIKVNKIISDGEYSKVLQYEKKVFDAIVNICT